MRQEKPHLFFIHLLRFLAFSDFSASRRHHSVSASYFGEGIVQVMPYSPERSIGAIRRGQTMALEAQKPSQCPNMERPSAMWACNLLRTKYFHGVSSGNQHAYWLQ